MKIPKLNWPLWTGFLLSLVAFLSYFFFFVSFPSTRDFPWANLLLFAGAAALLLVGLRRAFRADRPKPTRSKIAGAIVTTLSVAVFGSFVFFVFVLARQMPASQSAPQVGQKAPEFTLADSDGNSVSLAGLTSRDAKGKSPKGVLLVFYRGYW